MDNNSNNHYPTFEPYTGDRTDSTSCPSTLITDTSNIYKCDPGLSNSYILTTTTDGLKTSTDDNVYTDTPYIIKLFITPIEEEVQKRIDFTLEKYVIHNTHTFSIQPYEKYKLVIHCALSKNYQTLTSVVIDTQKEIIIEKPRQFRLSKNNNEFIKFIDYLVYNIKKLKTKDLLE